MNAGRSILLSAQSARNEALLLLGVSTIVRVTKWNALMIHG